MGFLLALGFGSYGSCNLKASAFLVFLFLTCCKPQMMLTESFIFDFEEFFFPSGGGRQFSHEVGSLPRSLLCIMYCALPVMFARSALSSARAHSGGGQRKTAHGEWYVLDYSALKAG